MSVSSLTRPRFWKNSKATGLSCSLFLSWYGLKSYMCIVDYFLTVNGDVPGAPSVPGIKG